MTQPITSSKNSLSICIIYHSNYGHTRRVAHAIAQGVELYSDSIVENKDSHTDVTKSIESICLDISKMNEAEWKVTDKADMLVFGCAVYMGSVTAEFKAFMDASSQRWFNRKWHGKWSAGFANSGGLSGDKLAVLQQICLFAMQHGMNWAGFPVMPTGHTDQDINRLSSFLGLMTQSLDAPPEQTPPEGDIQTAIKFGEHLAKVVSEQPPK